MSGASPRLRGVARMVSKIISALSQSTVALAGVSLVVIALLVVAEIVARNLLDRSTHVSTEFSGYLLVATVFLGTPYALRKQGLVRVEVVYSRLSAKPRYWLDIAVHVLSIMYTAVLLRFVWSLTTESYAFGTTSTYATETPLYIPQSFMVLGMFVLLLELCAGLAKVIVARPGGVNVSVDYSPDAEAVARSKEK